MPTEATRRIVREGFEQDEFLLAFVRRVADPVGPDGESACRTEPGMESDLIRRLREGMAPPALSAIQEFRLAPDPSAKGVGQAP
jgi:hypothetical protein